MKRPKKKMASRKTSSGRKSPSKKKVATSRAKTTSKKKVSSKKKVAPKKKAAKPRKEAAPRLVKVWLSNQGEDVESVWATVVGAEEDATLVRLENVPFLHAKPTFGDVIAAIPDEDGLLQWDRRGVRWSRIGTRIHEDGGRYAMIVDYEAKDVSRFRDLDAWLRKETFVPEGCFAPSDGRPGRLYLGVLEGSPAAAVMEKLAENEQGFTFTLVHPAP